MDGSTTTICLDLKTITGACQVCRLYSLSKAGTEGCLTGGKEPFLAVDEVMTAGIPLGLVLAETKFQAQAAARAVIVRYETLPAILSMEEAIEAESYFPYNKVIGTGSDKDIDAELGKCDHVFEGMARMGGQGQRNDRMLPPELTLAQNTSISRRMPALSFVGDLHAGPVSLLILSDEAKLEDGEMEIFSSTQNLTELQVGFALVQTVCMLTKSRNMLRK